MAVMPRDIPLTRLDMQGWIDAWLNDGTQTLEDYIRAQIDELSLPDRVVSTPNGDVDIADLVLGDLKSYVLPTS